jgi:hypothetical protein
MLERITGGGIGAEVARRNSVGGDHDILPDDQNPEQTTSLGAPPVVWPIVKRITVVAPTANAGAGAKVMI